VISARNWVLYLYFDPFGFYPIYVGAGQRVRPYTHLKRARAGRFHNNVDFLERLRSGLAWGVEPSIVIIDNLTAGEALGAEAIYIKVIGRRDLGNGPLYNKNAGWGLNREPPLPRRERSAMNSEASINRELRLRNPAYSPRSLRPAKVAAMPKTPKQTPSSWVKPLNFEVSPAQRADGNRMQAQRLQLAGLLKPIGPRAKNKGRLSPEQT
jgi:hypothetical protein